MSHDSVLQPFRPPVDLRIDYANALNPQQRAAVTAPPGPALVIAGAGAGKTRTLIYRVAFLLEQGIPGDRILLLTFTTKAAKEMMRRVTDLLGGDLSSLWGGTFHSIGNRILRRHADLLGYARNFTILDREDAKDLIVACLDEAGIDMKTSGFPKADVLADIFSLAMNTGKALRQIIEEQYDDLAPLAPQIEDMARRYAERKRADGVMDFDDLLVLWLKLLRDHAEVREQYQRRFQFILVDEYQDTNKLQSDLIDLLSTLPGNHDLQNRNQLPQHTGDPVAGQCRDRRQRAAICQTAHGHAPIRRQTGARSLRRRRRAGGVCRPARARAARRRHEPERPGGVVSLALSRAGTATGTDATQHSFQHHQRHPFLRAVAHQRRRRVSEARVQPAGRTGVQTAGPAAAGYWRQRRGQTMAGF